MALFPWHRKRSSQKFARSFQTQTPKGCATLTALLFFFGKSLGIRFKFFDRAASETGIQSEKNPLKSNSWWTSPSPEARYLWPFNGCPPEPFGQFPRGWRSFFFVLAWLCGAARERFCARARCLNWGGGGWDLRIFSLAKMLDDSFGRNKIMEFWENWKKEAV